MSPRIPLRAALRSFDHVFSEYHNDERARGRSEERTNKGERISKEKEKKNRGKREPGEYVRAGTALKPLHYARYVTATLFIEKRIVRYTRSRSFDTRSITGITPEDIISKKSILRIQQTVNTNDGPLSLRFSLSQIYTSPLSLVRTRKVSKSIRLSEHFYKTPRVSCVRNASFDEHVIIMSIRRDRDN